MSHVKGRLSFAHRQNKDGYATEIFDETNQVVATAAWYPVAIGHDGIGTNREENARRLVACWNACDGVSTESLELMPESIGGVLSTCKGKLRTSELLNDLQNNEIVALKAEVDLLRKVVPQTPQEVIEFIGHNFSSIEPVDEKGNPLGELSDVRYSLTVHDLLSAFSDLDNSLDSNSVELHQIKAVLKESGIDDLELWIAQKKFIDADHAISLGIIEELQRENNDLRNTATEVLDLYLSGHSDNHLMTDAMRNLRVALEKNHE